MYGSFSCKASHSSQTAQWRALLDLIALNQDDKLDGLLDIQRGVNQLSQAVDNQLKEGNSLLYVLLFLLLFCLVLLSVLLVGSIDSEHTRLRKNSSIITHDFALHFSLFQRFRFHITRSSSRTETQQVGKKSDLTAANQRSQELDKCESLLLLSFRFACFLILTKRQTQTCVYFIAAQVSWSEAAAVMRQHVRRFASSS